MQINVCIEKKRKAGREKHRGKRKKLYRETDKQRNNVCMWKKRKVGRE